MVPALEVHGSHKVLTGLRGYYSLYRGVLAVVPTSFQRGTGVLAVSPGLPYDSIQADCRHKKITIPSLEVHGSHEVLAGLIDYYSLYRGVLAVVPTTFQRWY